MNFGTYMAQADPWQPYGKGNGKHSPVPEPYSYGLLFFSITLIAFAMRKRK